MSDFFHTPVMLKECLEGLNIREKGVYLDLTFGGGGHSQAILQLLHPEGRLLGFDQDPAVMPQVEKILGGNFQFVAANFRHFYRYLKLYGIQKVDGILADLGVSSHQIDTPERGFSTRFEADLDMRMDSRNAQTAQSILNTYSEEALHKIFGIYGEVRNARTLAQAVVRSRSLKAIHTVEDLKSILHNYAPRGRSSKYFAQVFQALRIEVNDELKALEDMLQGSAEALKPGGRLVIMSYHSLEDRLVKNFIQKGKFHGEPEKDLYGNVYKPLQSIHRKPITASEEEIAQNNRARSAKLRVAERLADKN